MVPQNVKGHHLSSDKEEELQQEVEAKRGDYLGLVWKQVIDKPGHKNVTGHCLINL
jgi:hypothetical protein